MTKDQVQLLRDAGISETAIIDRILQETNAESPDGFGTETQPKPEPEPTPEPEYTSTLIALKEGGDRF